MLFPGTGVERGFSTFDEPRSTERRAGKTTDAVLDWPADRSDAQLLFLWVHYYDPHTSYAASPLYHEPTQMCSTSWPRSWRR